MTVERIGDLLEYELPALMLSDKAIRNSPAEDSCGRMIREPGAVRRVATTQAQQESSDPRRGVIATRRYRSGFPKFMH